MPKHGPHFLLGEEDWVHGVLDEGVHMGTALQGLQLVQVELDLERQVWGVHLWSCANNPHAFSAPLLVVLHGPGQHRELLGILRSHPSG